MAAYVGTQITGRIQAMLANITRSNGYHTDIGQHVAVGDMRRSLDEVPGVVILPGRETVSANYGINRTAQPYRFAAAVNRLATRIDAYPDAPTAEWVQIGAMVRDLRACLEARDSTLDGLVEHIGYAGTDEPIFGDSGGEIVAVDVLFEVRFAVAKGAPDTPL